MINTLHLTLKKEWFDMIAAGVKKEEYREIKPYWENRLKYQLPTVDRIEFRNGYKPDSPRITVEWLGLEVGKPNPDWFPRDLDLEENVFILKLGKIIEL